MKLKLITLALCFLATCTNTEAMQASKIRLATSFAKAAASTAKANPWTTAAALTATAAGSYVYSRYNKYNNRVHTLEKELRLLEQLPANDANVKLAHDKRAELTQAQNAARGAAQATFRGTRLTEDQKISLITCAALIGVCALGYVLNDGKPELQLYNMSKTYGGVYDAPKSLQFEWFPTEFKAITSEAEAILYGKNVSNHMRSVARRVAGLSSLIGLGIYTQEWLTTRDRAAGF